MAKNPIKKKITAVYKEHDIVEILVKNLTVKVNNKKEELKPLEKEFENRTRELKAWHELIIVYEDDHLNTG